MSPLGKALWYVESHFGSEITLGDIAEIAGVSSYYITRAFGDATGHSVMRYVRGRRLAEAARALANGAQNILSVALDAGYASHEAFTRAGQLGKMAYGVRCNSDEDGDFDYICGVAVSSFSKLPSEWSRVRIPAQKYAVFSHREHISTIRSTWSTIWNKWLPESGEELVDAPDFERYGEEFDSRTGAGGLEIWIPIKA